MPVFLRGWKRSTDCHLRELTAVGKLMDMHAFPPFMMLSIHHFLKRSTKRNVTPSLLRSMHLPNFSVVVFLYRILLLSMMRCDIHFLSCPPIHFYRYIISKAVPLFPPSASLKHKKRHQKTILCFLMSFPSFQADAWINLSEAKTDFSGAFRTNRL